MRTRMMLIAAAGVSALAGPALAEDGATIFSQNCAACHQPQGQGVPGAFPKLAGDPFVQGPAQPVAHTILNGRGGMPTFGPELTDEQIAAVASYIRSSWGNKADPITPAMVAAERAAGQVAPPSDGQQAH
jgi:cytochrome c6